jgi:ABC transporter substrate binding protein
MRNCIRVTVPILIITVTFAFAVALGSAVEAQQLKRVPRIGYFAARSATSAPSRDEAFRQGLRDLGYVDGQNIIVEWRFAEGQLDRLPSLAAELVQLNPDVIVSTGPLNTRALQHAAATIPIVMVQDADPVSNGVCCHPRASRRQHYWVVNGLAGNQRKTAGAFNRDRPRDLEGGCARKFDRTGQPARITRSARRGSEVQDSGAVY